MARKKAPNGSGTIRYKEITRGGKTYGYWEGRITTGRNPATGEQVQRTFTGKTQKEVLEKMQAASVAVTQGTYLEPSKMFLADWVETWIEEYCSHVKESTRESYRQQTKKHICKIGAVRLCELNTHAIQTLYNGLQRDGLSAKTIKNIHSILHRALKQACDMELIARNPAKACTSPAWRSRKSSRSRMRRSPPFSRPSKGIAMSACSL